MSKVESYLLGMDCGTTNLKAIILGEDGTVVAEASRPSTFMDLKSDMREQDANEWWDNAKAVFKEKTVFTEEEWLLLAEGYNELAKLAAEKGMKVCLHHHMGTGIQTPAEIDKYMAVVNDDVYLLFDSGHIYYSEGSQKAMLDVLEKYIDRICHVHLKDVRDEVVAEVKANDLSFLEGVRKGTFTVPGDGVIDFRPIFDILEKHNYKGWMVVEAEQDPAIANPFEYAVKGRKYIKET